MTFHDIRDSISAQLQALLPLKQLTFVCEITQDTELQFFHQTSLPAYIYTLLDALPPEQAKTAFRLLLPETGATFYRKGDEYRFSVLTFNGAEQYFLQLITALEQGIVATDRRIWHRNLQLRQLVDAFTGKVITDIAGLSEYDYPKLQQDARALQQHPCRLLVESGIWFNAAKMTGADLSDKAFISQLAIAVIYATPAAQAEQTRQVQQLQTWLEAAAFPPLIQMHSLFFVNKNYTNAAAKQKYLSGYHGHLALRATGSSAEGQLISELLVLGQYLGLGKRTNYGIGQYRLTGQKYALKQQPKRSRSLLPELLSRERISRNPAYLAATKSEQAAVWEIVGQMTAGTYMPPPRQCCTQSRTHLSGDKKSIMVNMPPPAEYIVQHVLAQGLSACLDPLQHHSSYANRPKRNRQQAVKALKQYIDHGQVWLLEGDMANCFQQTAPQMVVNRLASLFPDAELCRCIEQILTASVAGAEEAQAGLLQDSPLSGVLINMMLSDFDYELSQQGYQHIRSGDDFIVCAVDEHQVHQARQACLELLAKRGLSPDACQTHIRQMSSSMVFLADDADEQSAAVHCGDNPEAPAASCRDAVNPVTDYGQTLLICTGHCSLSLDDNQLVIQEERREERTPLALIQQIILIGRHHLTTPLVQYCLKQGIHIHYLSATGKHLGTLDAANRRTCEYKVQLWLKQQTYLSDENVRLQLSKEIIAARVHNMRKTLLRYRHHNLSGLENALRHIPKTTSPDELRGHEGLATGFYYLQLNQLLGDTAFDFPKRNRRPPKDPVNVLLSYGYSLLYQYLHSFLLSVDINPDRGFMHRSQSRHIALCSDLIEPFRHYVERAALTVIRRKQIQTGHFYYQGEQCLFTGQGRSIYTRYLTRLLESNAGHADIAKPRYVEHIYRQAADFKKHLQQPECVPFTAYRE